MTCQIPAFRLSTFSFPFRLLSFLRVVGRMWEKQWLGQATWEWMSVFLVVQNVLFSLLRVAVLFPLYQCHPVHVVAWSRRISERIGPQRYCLTWLYDVGFDAVVWVFVEVGVTFSCSFLFDVSVVSLTGEGVSCPRHLNVDKSQARGSWDWPDWWRRSGHILGRCGLIQIGEA
jgi:hypothetical protein